MPVASAARPEAILLWAAACCLPSALWAETETAKLIASNGREGDLFGAAVSVFQERLIVGAEHADANGENSGLAYVYELEGDEWVESAILESSDARAGDRFGGAVDLDRNRIIVGAQKGDIFRDELPGAAYIFGPGGGKKSNWVEIAKLTPEVENPQDWFGSAVAISDRLAAVGAFRVGGAGRLGLVGAAYIFEDLPQGWTQTSTIVGSDVAQGDAFGFSLDIGDNFIAVGAQGDDDGGNDAGAVYIFEPSPTGWVESAKLIPHDATSGSSFGISVAAAQNRVIVGAHSDDEQAIDGGSAYVFERRNGTWLEVAKLLAPDGARGDAFGFSVDISGGLAVVGARHGDNDNGSSYVFELMEDEWSQKAKLTASDAQFIDQLGYSVSLYKGRVAAGAWKEDENGEDSGAAYVFLVPEPSTLGLTLMLLSLLLGGRRRMP